MGRVLSLAAASVLICIAACAATLAAPILFGSGAALVLRDALGREAGLGAFLAAAGVAAFVLARRRAKRDACGCARASGGLPIEAPIACTLSPDAMAVRLAEISALTREALIEQERDDLTLRLRYAHAASDRVRAMVRKEEACCAFLAFEVREEPEAIVVVVRAPPEAREAADFAFKQLAGASD